MKRTRSACLPGLTSTTRLSNINPSKQTETALQGIAHSSLSPCLMNTAGRWTLSPDSDWQQKCQKPVSQPLPLKPQCPTSLLKVRWTFVHPNFISNLSLVWSQHLPISITALTAHSLLQLGEPHTNSVPALWRPYTNCHRSWLRRPRSLSTWSSDSRGRPSLSWTTLRGAQGKHMSLTLTSVEYLLGSLPCPIENF